jgi:prepilin-type N-terminal cleavage/methylation domain-containing protein
MLKIRIKKGFTLVELLVVISIIALLLSILMPSLGKAKEQARMVVCKSTLKQWGTVFSLYAQENDGKFMAGYWNQKAGFPTVHTTDQWPGALKPYYQNPKLRLCPNAIRAATYFHSNYKFPTGPDQAWGNFGNNTSKNSAFDGEWYGSYGINGWVHNPPATTDLYPGYRDSLKTDAFLRKASVPNASNTPLMLDALWLELYPTPTDTVCNTPAEVYNAINPYGSNAGGLPRACVPRHSSANGYKQNVIFLDSSVRDVKMMEFWGLKWHRGFVQRIPTNFPPFMK